MLTRSAFILACLASAAMATQEHGESCTKHALKDAMKNSKKAEDASEMVQGVELGQKGITRNLAQLGAKIGKPQNPHGKGLHEISVGEEEIILPPKQGEKVKDAAQSESEDESAESESEDEIAEEVDEELVQGGIFAQLSSRVGASHTCQSAHKRNKAPLEDFWSIYNGTSQYTDTDFVAGPEALYWSDMGESN